MLIVGAFWLANEVAAHPGRGETEKESDPAGPLPRLKDSRQEVAFKSSPTATVGISRAWNKQHGMEEGWGDGNRNCHREGNRV